MDEDVDVVLSKATTYLNANSLNMTDLWVLDYMEWQNCAADTPDSDGCDWGQAYDDAAYGSHHVYF